LREPAANGGEEVGCADGELDHDGRRIAKRATSGAGEGEVLSFAGRFRGKATAIRRP
jgi:hypothetical protein